MEVTVEMVNGANIQGSLKIKVSDVLMITRGCVSVDVDSVVDGRVFVRPAADAAVEEPGDAALPDGGGVRRRRRPPLDLQRPRLGRRRPQNLSRSAPIRSF